MITLFSVFFTLQGNDASLDDLSNTLVALGLSQLTLTSPPNDCITSDEPHPAPAVPMQTLDEDLFNVSDGILTDFD